MKPSGFPTVIWKLSICLCGHMSWLCGPGHAPKTPVWPRTVPYSAKAPIGGVPAIPEATSSPGLYAAPSSPHTAPVRPLPALRRVAPPAGPTRWAAAALPHAAGLPQSNSNALPATLPAPLAGGPLLPQVCPGGKVGSVYHWWPLPQWAEHQGCRWTHNGSHMLFSHIHITLDGGWQFPAGTHPVARSSLMRV